MIDNNKVVEILRKVIDRKTGLDLITSRRVSELQVKDKQIFFTLSVNDLDQDAKFEINGQCYGVLKQEFKDAEIHIHFAKADGGTNTVLPQVKNIIAVASGKGGVGKSTISVNLALSLQQRGYKVGLMDADLYGPSIPTMLNLKGVKPSVQEVYGTPKLIPIEQYGIHVISIGFIVDPEQAVILRGPRLSGVIKQFVTECIWPELDFMIIDLPPGTGDIQLTLVQSIPITGALLVSTPQDVSVVDAVKAANMFTRDNIKVPLIGIVENMSWFTPEELPNNKYYLFGEGGGKKLARKYNSVLLGQIPLVQGIREGGDAGIPIALQKDHPVSPIIQEMTERFLQQVALRHELFAPTERVRITT